MDGDGDADHICDEDEVAVGVRLVGTVFPLEDKPEHESRAERGEGVNLTLDCGKPEGVAPAVGEGSGQAAAHDYEILRERELLVVVVADSEPAHEVGNGPEKEQDCEGAEQAAHCVDEH